MNDVIDFKQQKEMRMSTSKVKFTVFDIQTITSILDMRTQQGATIKDLRLIDSTARLLKKDLPEAPAQPQIRNVSDGAPHTAEEKKKFQEDINLWNKAMEDHTNKEIEIELSPVNLNLIKQRLQTFSHYFSDPDARKKVIELADKLGIQ